jgi:Mor family transcriptional regulator
MPAADWSLTDWNALAEEVQLALSREALRRAADTLAEHAELLAVEMEHGTLNDRGGPDALRLFAAVVRATNADAFGPVGHA